MAIDSAPKRLSIMDFDSPIAPAIPAPTGAFDVFGERQHLLWLYSGIQASGAVTPEQYQDRGLLIKVGRMIH